MQLRNFLIWFMWLIRMLFLNRGSDTEICWWRGMTANISGITTKSIYVKVPGFLVCDDGVGCIFASLLKPSRLPLIASKASSRLFSPVWEQNGKVSKSTLSYINEPRTHPKKTGCGETHLWFDTTEQPQLLFLFLKLSSFSVLLQHLLLLLQTLPVC